MGWWITLGVLSLLAILPLGVRVTYDGGGPLVKAVLGPVKFTVYPRTGKEKKSPQKTEKKPETKKTQEEEKLPKPPQPPKAKKSAKTEKGGSLSDFFPFGGGTSKKRLCKIKDECSIFYLQIPSFSV